MEPFELTPDRLERLVHRFRAKVDSGWVDYCVRKIAEGRDPEEFGEGRPLVEALRDLSQILDALHSEYTPPNPEHVPILGTIAYVVANASDVEGADALFQILRHQADKRTAGGFRHFFNFLFEGEVAVYCHKASDVPVRFDPEARPDVWVTGTADGREIPIECKRIWQAGRERVRFQRLRDNLPTAYDQLRTSVEHSDIGSGIVAVKIQQPANRKELWDADQIVRRSFPTVPHVGFVSLFWNYRHAHSGPWLYGPDEVPRRTRIEAYTLTEYRVPNSVARENLTRHESRLAYFPDGPPE